MIKQIFPLKNAYIIIEIYTSGDYDLTRTYLVTSENRYLGTDSLKRTQKNAKKIKDKFEQYLDHTMYTEYDGFGLYDSFETLISATFVYKDLNPRIKFYFTEYELKKTDIVEFGIDDDMIREWINQLNCLLSI